MAAPWSQTSTISLCWSQVGYELGRGLLGCIVLVTGLFLAITITDTSSPPRESVWQPTTLLLLIHIKLVVGVWLVSIWWNAGGIISRYNVLRCMFCDPVTSLIAVCMFGILWGTLGSLRSNTHPLTAFFLAREGVDVTRLQDDPFAVRLAPVRQLQQACVVTEAPTTAMETCPIRSESGSVGDIQYTKGRRSFCIYEKQTFASLSPELYCQFRD